MDIKLSIDDFAWMLDKMYIIRDAARKGLDNQQDWDVMSSSLTKAYLESRSVLQNILEPKADKILARAEYAKKRGL